MTSGGHADVLLVLVQGDGEGLDCYAVERGDGGVRSTARGRGSGCAATPASRWRSTACAVDDEARIGAAGAGGDLVFGVVAPIVPGRAGGGQRRHRAGGGARRDGARRGAPLRRTGGSLAEVQTIQHLLADMDLPTRSARLLVREAAALGDAGDAAALVALMEAKVARDRGGAARHPARARGLRRSGLHAVAADRAPPPRRARRRGDGADQRRAADVDRQGPRRTPRPVSARRAAGRRGRPTTRASSRSGSASATYFAEAGVPTDYVLFSNYERQVEAVLAGDGRHRLEHQHRLRRARPPGRRRDADPRHARRGRRLGDRAGDAQGRRGRPTCRARGREAGARQPGLRPRGDPAAALPGRRAWTRRRSASCCASTPISASTATRATPSCTSSRAVADGEADAGALSDAYFSASGPRGCPRSPASRSSWRSPAYYHCNFTVLDSFDAEVGRAVVRGAAGDGLRRSVAAAGDGARERLALAAGRPRGLRSR